MQLYGSTVSPFVRHCRVVLMTSGLDFEFIETDTTEAVKLSPLAKIPCLRDAELFLHDSSSILKHVREKAGQDFLSDVQDFDLFAVCNTILDSVVNLFMLERFGMKGDENDYLKRQQARVETGLHALEALLTARFADVDSTTVLNNDALLRIASFIEWAQFRQRIDVQGCEHLQRIVALALEQNSFALTSPFRQN